MRIMRALMANTTSVIARIEARLHCCCHKASETSWAAPANTNPLDNTASASVRPVWAAPAPKAAPKTLIPGNSGRTSRNPVRAPRHVTGAWGNDFCGDADKDMGQADQKREVDLKEQADRMALEWRISSVRAMQMQALRLCNSVAKFMVETNF